MCNALLTSLLFLSSADTLRSLPRNRNGIDMDSDVYKMLQDYERPVSEPKQSGSFRYLQGMLEAGENGKTHNIPGSLHFVLKKTCILLL